MKPDSVETILKKARHAQFAILVCAIVWPFLSIWTIELIAHRKEITSNAFWIRFCCTAGIWIILYFWVARTSRAVVGKKNQVPRHDRLDRWLLIGVVVLVLLNVAFMLTDDSFGAWPNVDATVVLHMLALPALAVCLYYWDSSDLSLLLRSRELFLYTLTRRVHKLFHTNNIEGFWSHLKRGIKGVYIQVMMNGHRQSRATAI